MNSDSHRRRAGIPAGRFERFTLIPMKMLPVFLAVSFLLVEVKAGDRTAGPLVLGGDHADHSVYLYDPLQKEEKKSPVWRFPKEGEPRLPERPSDVKRVDIDGRILILISYGRAEGATCRVRLVDFATGMVMRDFEAPVGCHSVEMLPDGNIVTANASGTVRLHRENDCQDMEVPGAHGVVWDRKRGKLWVNGDKLYLMDYENHELGIIDEFALPGGIGDGHDLFPSLGDDLLLVTDGEGVYEFDCENKIFRTLCDRRGVKSVSQHSDGSIWITDPTDLEGYERFQTGNLMRIVPGSPPLSYNNKGARFYKARWWHKNSFSY